MAGLLDVVSFFRVPLACEAAPKIGCGLLAKPLLKALERDPAVAKACLNRAGNLVAVVWASDDGGMAARRRALGALHERGLKIAELRGIARARAMNGFSTEPSSWHQSASIDVLSREEARLIARRMIARVRARTSLAALEARAAVKIIARACEQELILRPTQSATLRKRRITSAILRAARGHLADAVFDALAQAARLGHRPLPGER